LKLRTRAVIDGLLSFNPIPQRKHTKPAGGGNSESARYCYSVWMRHLIYAVRNSGLHFPFNILAEIGPGNSLGIGLAALLSGVEKYRAFEIENYEISRTNLEIFDELVNLFNLRSPIPGFDEFPEVKPAIENYDFPSDILTDEILSISLSRERLAKIRASIQTSQSKPANDIIRLEVPWNASTTKTNEKIDMILSQAVMEHIDDLEGTYRSMTEWLSTSGIISHQIDFRSHGLTEEWNGHWTIPSWIWWLMRGRKRFLLNRQPASRHRDLILKQGLAIRYERAVKTPSPLLSHQLTAQFSHLNSDDLNTSGLFIQASRQPK
jgi:hypothetical protein